MFKLFKKKETNNSVMVLLKKLKRHDTKVVAVAVIIALILSGGLIYVSTPIVASNATEEIAESTSQSNRETSEKLTQISDYLGELDKIVTSNQNSLSKITEYNNNNSSTSSSKETVTETEKSTNTVNNKVTELGGTLKEVHTSISTVTTKIESLQKEIEKNEKSDKEQIAKDFELVNQELTNIQTAYEDAKKENKELIEKLQKEVSDGNKKNADGMTANQTALLAELEKIGKDLDTKSTQSITGFQTDLAKFGESVAQQIETLNTSVNAQLQATNSNVNEKLDSMNTNVNEKINNVNNSVNEKINDVNTNVDNKLGNMNTSVTDQFNTMNSSVNTGFEGLKEYIDTAAGNINTKLDQVFQRVSDGKKLLASTLLTKGVVIKEDATFLEISEAILNIPTTITIEEIPGEVVYEKHYHVDGNGTVCNEKYVPASRKGGCYTAEYVHHHDDSCYTTSTYYSYLTDVGTHSHEWLRNENGKDVYRFTCDYCSGVFEGTAGGHRETRSTYAEAKARGGTDIEKKTKRKLTCKIKEKQVIGYSCSCGYLHGQILKAHINYSKKKKSPASSYLRTSNVVQLGDDAMGNEALDALRQLTEYDMNAESFDPEKEDETAEESSDNNMEDTFGDEESANTETSNIEVSKEAAAAQSQEEKETEPSTEDDVEAGSFDNGEDNSSEAAGEALSETSGRDPLETEEENSENKAENELS